MTYAQAVSSTISPFGVPVLDVLSDEPLVIGRRSASAQSSEVVP
jgi:hypothetical protein